MKNVSSETRRKLSECKIGDKNHFFGKKHSEDSREKMRSSAKRRWARLTAEEKAEINWHMKGRTGELHHNYISDRSQLKRDDRRNDSAYNDWRRCVYKRDDYKCLLKDDHCEGRIEAHHISSWRDNPELRYEINNGITLCHFHHPRGAEEEKRLEITLKNLVSVSSE